MNWLEIKALLESCTGLDRDALHIYAAVGIQLGLALFARKSLASPWPWLAALAAVLANEYVDYKSVGDSVAAQQLVWDASYHDIWNTMLLPTLLLLIAKFWPSWLVGSPKTGDLAGDDDIDLNEKA